MPKKNKYWRERAEEEIKHSIKRDRDVSKRVEEIHDYYFNEIEKEIRAFQQRYANRNNIPLEEVKKRLDDMDVEKFAKKAKRYVKEKDFSARANYELGVYNLKMRMNRLEMLERQLDLQLIALANEEEKTAKRFLNDEYIKNVETQAGLLGESVGNLSANMERVVNTTFKGANWSDKIWKRQNALREVVARTVEKAILLGENPTKQISTLRREFDVSASQAKRLLVTEGARVAVQGQADAISKAGYDYYEFIAEPKACSICKPLDGKVFKISELLAGENASPMHPHCKCAIAADEGE